MCKNHQSSPCLAKHEHIPGQEQRAKNVENSSTEHLFGGDIGKKMSENDLDKTNVGKRLLGEGDSNNERVPKAIAKETVGKEMSAKDVLYP